MEIFFYLVCHPQDLEVDLTAFKRDPQAAWRHRLNMPDADRYELKRAAQKIASLEGLRCECYRLQRTGVAPNLGLNY